MKQYIIINEDATVWHYTGELTDNIILSFEEGYYDIIDITDPINPKQLTTLSDIESGGTPVEKFIMDN